MGLYPLILDLPSLFNLYYVKGLKGAHTESLGSQAAELSIYTSKLQFLQNIAAHSDWVGVSIKPSLYKSNSAEKIRRGLDSKGIVGR